MLIDARYLCPPPWVKIGRSHDVTLGTHDLTPPLGKGVVTVVSCRVLLFLDDVKGTVSACIKDVLSLLDCYGSGIVDVDTFLCLVLKAV